MKTLAIDTSSLACSCAAVEDGQLRAECYLRTGLTHSRTLAGLIRETMAHAGWRADAIDRLAVCAGPGSYTGLRIGVSTVKGMAAAYETPCVGVSTLLSLAENVALYDGTVCAALDARAGQVYAALFEIRGGEISRLTEDDAMKLTELGTILPDGSLVVGDGALLVCKAFPEKNLRAAPEALRYQRASSAAFLAEKAEPVPASRLVPDYHRLSQAERERAAREKQQTCSENPLS